MKLEAAWATDTGKVRPGNEDSLLIDDRLGVFAVADGMGGHRGGEVASSTAVEAVRVAMAGGASIDAAILAANTAIRERASGDPDVMGMGTTFTAIVPLDDANVLIGHVGDSRAYMLRDGDLRKLTRDHSLVEDLVREGRITQDQADVHPQRSIITRALGIEPEIDVDLYTVTVREGDRLLICSDGLTDMLSDADVARVAATHDDASAAAHALVDAANEAGGIDNITVVLLDVTEVDAPAAFVDHGHDLDDEGDSTVRRGAASPTVESSSGVGAAPVSSTSGRWRKARTGLRVLGVVLPLLLIFGVAFGVVWYRATHTYFVAQIDGEVVLRKGVPGGILWFEPTTVGRTGLKTGLLTDEGRARIGDGYCESTSRAAAEACIAALDAERRRAQSTTTTTPSTTPLPTTTAATPTTRSTATTTTVRPPT